MGKWSGQKDYMKEYNKRPAAVRSRRNWRAKNHEQELQKKREWHEDHKDENKAKREAVKKSVIEHYGGKCACCGETEIIFLTIDHVNNDGAEHRKKVFGRKSAGFNMYGWLIKNGFPDGFQVLCWNCNLGKHINGGVCPHQKEAQ